MKIDIFTHVVPEKYKQALAKVAPGSEANRKLCPRSTIWTRGSP